VQKSVHQDEKCEPPAEGGSKLVISPVSGSSELPAAASCKQVTDYSHLYIYKRNTSLTQSRKTAEYIALSSASSDEDEDGHQLVAVSNVSSIDDMSVTAADTTLSSNIHTAKYLKLYRSPNIGVQVANPNKKKKRKRS